MKKFRSVPLFLYDRIILKFSKTVIFLVMAAVVILGIGAKKFRLDASAETLVLQNDQDLKYARMIESRYGGTDILVLAFKPKEDLFSDRILKTIANLREELKRVDKIESVMTILDVPLLLSPPVPLQELGSKTITLESKESDRNLARKEFAESPLYKDLLVSPDLKTTAILITFPNDQTYESLMHKRDALRDKKIAGTLSGAEKKEFKKVSREFLEYKDQFRSQRHKDLKEIRSIMDKYSPEGSFYLGGVSMIADDMISYIKNDLRIFGTAVFILLVVAIAVIFKRIYWVILPMLICIVSVICTVGFLGWAGWEVTVISSNFISLQLIITLAMTIHLMVRYREFAAARPNETQRKLILLTIREMARPCVYSGLTTMAGFASLIFCNILPVITFGCIMVFGVAVSIIVPFLLFPTVLMLLPKDKPQLKINKKLTFTPMLGRFTVAYGSWILAASLILLAVNIVGIRRLKVENCFINYFKKNTEIHQGLKIVDQQLGGTTPLDVVIDFEQNQPGSLKSDNNENTQDEFEKFEEPENASGESQYKYWFTPEKLNRISEVHNYLEKLPETGKVISVVTLVRMIEQANGGKPLDAIELAVLFNKIPEKLKQLLVYPYVSIENNQVRLMVRVLDSHPELNRNELLKKIHSDLTEKFGFSQGQVHLAGTLVLYNNMLQNLYKSQIVTMGFATLSLIGAFVILFRSIRIAIIAIFPNILAISCVLGLMGWFNIPLDMMTITIAAIGVGLADDDTIHYLHRFKHEVQAEGSYETALHRSHDSIGHAIYYTTVTLVIGFSILTLSSFIPTILFGLLTVLAITVALFASLTVLPQLLVLLKPYGKEPKIKEEREDIEL